MATVEIFNHSMTDIGYIGRTVTQGDELNMVNRYIEFLVSRYSNLKRKKVSIFVEPQIDSGYPDIVIVEQYIGHELLWDNNRWNLNIADLKILYQIQLQRRTSLSELNELLGFSYSEIQKSVERLYECNLIHVSKTKKHIRNIPLNKYCAIKKIISVEAKIDKWADAIKQAERNIWFSTESYILMNKASCSTSMREECKKRGIGIILVNGTINKSLESEKRTFPVSYASLQFNEWLQKSEKLEVKDI